jgi:hypothetical protein
MDLQQILNRFMKWDVKKTPTIDQIWEVEEEIKRLQSIASMKDVVTKYIAMRKQKICKEIANCEGDPKVSSDVIRAACGHLSEVIQWEKDILTAEYQSKTISDWFASWNKKQP